MPVPNIPHTTHKYNIPHTQKDDFIRALAQVVKPDGIVFITDASEDRFTFNCYAGEAPYLTDTFRKYFDNASFTTRRSVHGSDQLMTLTAPKLTLAKQQHVEVKEDEKPNHAIFRI